MPRIDATIATQLADTTRPRQTVEQQRFVSEQAKVEDLAKAQAGEAEPPPSYDELHAAAAQVRQIIEVTSGKRFAYQLAVDDKTNSLVARFSDPDGNVVKQLPSEEILALRGRLQELVGMFLDETA